MRAAFDPVRRRLNGAAAALPLALVGAPLGRAANLLARGVPQTGLAALSLADGWLNTPPLEAAALRGRPVLVQFWTYSCINWLRTLPYVRAWAAKYRAAGLVVIGVHAPEFGFEKDLANVRGALKAMRIVYPVAIDNAHAIWRAFDNDYWPALYFIDGEGRIRAHQFGEGDYGRSERILQMLLAESNAAANSGLVRFEGAGIEAAADWDDLRSPENYLGYARTENFFSPGGTAPDQARVYAIPPRLALNGWALGGAWTMGAQPVAANAPGGRIACRFHARDLHMVLGPGAAAGTPGTRFRVLLDGAPPGASHGLDIDAQGNGAIGGPRLYQLVRQARPIADRLFTIEFSQPGVQAYAFTFG